MNRWKTALYGSFIGFGASWIGSFFIRELWGATIIFLILTIAIAIIGMLGFAPWSMGGL